MSELSTEEGTSGDAAQSEQTGQALPLVFFDPANRVTQIKMMPPISIAGTVIVRFTLHGADGRPLITLNQDLEDTLGIGGFIVEIVAEALETTTETMLREVWTESLGEHFEEMLSRAEAATQKVRQLVGTAAKAE